MFDVLADNPLLTIFLAVGLGTLLGAIPLGPVRFGPAGALFVGLALGAADERLGEGLALVQSLGLALFVYTVGVASGAAFFRGLKRQLPLMAATIGVLAAAMVVTVVQNTRWKMLWIEPRWVSCAPLGNPVVPDV